MRFAYLIIAHDSLELLKELIKALDAPENDLFIHLDRKFGKMDDRSFSVLAKSSKVTFIKKRISVSWGRVSVVEATLNLLAESVKGYYDYYHLLSGVDFPIKSNKYIHDFFQRNEGREFVGFIHHWDSVIQRRVSYYHLIGGNLERKHTYARKTGSLLLRTQRRLHIYRHRPGYVFKGGPQWFSITHDLATALLRDKDAILSRYKYVGIPDELFLQTFIHSKPLFRERIYNADDAYMGCLRKIDWTRGKPYTWQSADYDELISSPHLWARKFSESDMDIVKRLARHIRTQTY